jgi:Na+/proline symporter
MSTLDWAVLFGTIMAIVGYGLWRERGGGSSAAFLGSSRELKWWTIGLSVMATQASAITFLSMPGQAYEDGMGFVQFYFGQPIAMVLIAAFIAPIYFRLNVRTAYEYLEGRFDRKTRQLVAALFLVSRGLAAGISIYAPAIVVSTVLDWPLQLTNAAIGSLVIAYTLSGGSRIVARTQTYQMVVMLCGMAVAAFVVWSQLPGELGFGQALHLAGALGKMNLVDASLRFDTRYTLLSGLTGGLFVGLAYFGTDQSQVQRYLGGESLAQSKLGLVFNGLVKVPMQTLILFVGVLVFLFYQFNAPPPFFARAAWARTEAGPRAQIEAEWEQAFRARRERAIAYVQTQSEADKAALQQAGRAMDGVRSKAKALAGNVKDQDYVFIDFVVRRFPQGLVGLLLAVIFSAAMSAVAAALSSLGSTTVVDFYKASVNPQASDAQSLRVAKLATAAWGLVAVGFAAFAARLENLIQAVNILGSLFYGPMLGVFLAGFFVKRARATPVFLGLIAAQVAVAAMFVFSNIGFLWYNVVGCAVVLAAAAIGALRASPVR